MFTTYFSSNQVLLFLGIAILHIISLYYFSFNKGIKYALYFLFAGGLLSRVGIISFDDYLHLWDEQFHALVAKNIAENSSAPMLFKYTPLDYSPTNWAENHIWLHKQPWFLWQMALSIKIFGATPFAVRLPSAVMTSLLVLVIYRMGKVVINERVGYLSAFLYAMCNYLLDFNTGQYNTDHNDLAFIFYVALSIWAYTEYRAGNRLKFVWLIGIFAGIAVLNKWLTGLLVFSGWSVSILFIPGWKEKLHDLKNMLRALSVCVLVFIPWQIYILTAFPIESRAEYEYSSRHLFEVIEGHTGTWTYHFDQAAIQYGAWMAYLLPLALVVLFISIKDIRVRVSYIAFVLITYLFFTVATTKMPAFCLIVMPILFMAIGNFINKVFGYLEQIRAKQFLLRSIEFLILMVLGTISFNIEKLQANHTFWIDNDIRAIVTKDIINATETGRTLYGKYNEHKTVIINCHEVDNIPIMFFSGYTAYNRIPTDKELNWLKQNGYKILYMEYLLPISENLKADTSISIIEAVRKKTIRIHIKAADGKYVCADESLDNTLVANRDSASAWERFTIVQFGDQCVVQAHNGKLLCAELNNNGEVTATREAIGPWETFKIVQLHDNIVAFKAANGKYFSIGSEGQIYAKSDSISEKEQFELITLSVP